MLKLKKEKNLNNLLFDNDKNGKKSKETKNKFIDIVKKLKSVNSTPNIAINKELLFSYIE